MIGYRWLLIVYTCTILKVNVKTGPTKTELAETLVMAMSCTRVLKQSHSVTILTAQSSHWNYTTQLKLPQWTRKNFLMDLKLDILAHHRNFMFLTLKIGDHESILKQHYRIRVN